MHRGLIAALVIGGAAVVAFFFMGGKARASTRGGRDDVAPTSPGWAEGHSEYADGPNAQNWNRYFESLPKCGVDVKCSTFHTAGVNYTPGGTTPLPKYDPYFSNDPTRTNGNPITPTGQPSVEPPPPPPAPSGDVMTTLPERPKFNMPWSPQQVQSTLNHF